MPKSKSKRRKTPKAHKAARKGSKGARATAGATIGAKSGASTGASTGAKSGATTGGKSGAKRAGIPWGGKSGAGTRKLNIAIAVVVVVALAGGGVYWGRSLLAERDFMALAAQGQDRLSAIESQVDHGGGHLNPGESYVYPESIPTSGRHDTTWVTAGFYDAQQRQTRLVHALEHGNVVIYYGRLDPDAAKSVHEWTGLYGGQWDGVIAAPLPGLGEGIVLAAWNKLLRLERFDPAVAAAFIDRFRGRGPEQPVR